MLSNLEKKIIKLLKEKNIDKETIIPTMLIIKDMKEYQKKMLFFLETVGILDEETLLIEIEKMGFLEDNPNLI